MKPGGSDRTAGESWWGGTPDLEVVDVPREQSFKAWSHGYPYRTVRWHFHPEYEIHLITETSGRTFIGDYIGTFAPGNLVMTGPNLPHNWISDIDPSVVIPRRCLIIQFTEEFVTGLTSIVPEVRAVRAMLDDAASGIEFAAATGEAALSLFETLVAASGIERVAPFFRLLALLHSSQRRKLASAGYKSTPELYTTDPLNHVLSHIARNLGRDFCQADLAALSGFSPSAFSRAFERHTGLTFVRYVNELRINRACELLATTDQSIARICFEVGFRNLSNFNRHFLLRKNMSPSHFRRLQQMNAQVSDSARRRERETAFH